MEMDARILYQSRQAKARWWLRLGVVWNVSELWKRWKAWRAIETIETKGRSELAVGLGAVGFEHKTMEINAGNKFYVKNLLQEAVATVSLDKSGQRCRHTNCGKKKACNCQG